VIYKIKETPSKLAKEAFTHFQSDRFSAVVNDAMAFEILKTAAGLIRRPLLMIAF